MMMSINVNVMADGVAVVSIRGEIDHSTAPQLGDEIQSLLTNRRPVVVRIDLGLVTFIDSAAIGALVTVHRLAATEGARLVVDRASPFVRRQLQIAGVQELLGAPSGCGSGRWLTDH